VYFEQLTVDNLVLYMLTLYRRHSPEVQIPIDEREALPLSALGGGNDRRQTAPPVIENKGLGSSLQKLEVNLGGVTLN
jgi:hypothetical protein